MKNEKAEPLPVISEVPQKSVKVPCRDRMVTARDCRAESLGSIPVSGMFFYLFFQLGVLENSRTLSSD
ncbi:unnamed protein product [Ixodes persulcatus]